MATGNATRLPLKSLARRLGVASPNRVLVKVERSSSPPPLTEDNSGVLEDGEIHEQQGAVYSLQGRFSIRRKLPG